MTVNEEVSLAIRIVDGVSATAKQIQASTDDAKVSVDALDASMDRVGASIDSVKSDLSSVKVESGVTSSKVKTDATEIDGRLDATLAHAKSVQTQMDQTATKIKGSISEMQTQQALELSSLMGIKESVGSVIGGVTALGLVSQETAQDLAKVNAAFQLMAGAATGLKTLQVLMTSLNAQTAINASLNTFLSVVRNHALGMAAVGAGLGAMAGVAGMYLYTNNQSSKTVNINVDGGGSSAVAQEIYTVINGGAL